MQLHAVRARIHSLGKRVRLGVGGGGLQVAGSLRTGLGIAQFSMILGRRATVGYIRGWFRRGCEKGVVVNRGGRGGDTWKWIFIECLRGSGGRGESGS